MNQAGNLNITLSTTMYSLVLLSGCIYPGYFPFDVNILLAIGTGLMFVASRGWQKNYFRIPTWPLFFVLLIVLIQVSLFASNSLSAPHAWLLQTSLYITALLMFFVGANMTVPRLEQWMEIYILISMVWLGVGWFVWLGGTSGHPLELGSFTFSMAPAKKLAGPFNQGNIFAAGIGMAWIFSHWLLLKHRSWQTQLSVAILTAAMFGTLSRGGWLAFTPCLGILLYSFRSEIKKTALLLCSLWAIGIVIGLVTFFLSQPESFEKGFLDIANSAATSLEARLLIWGSSIIIFLDHPITGAGWGQFANQFWLARPEASVHLESILGHSPVLPSSALSAHNLTLQFISEGGILLFTGLMVGLCFYIVRVRQLINRCSPRLPFALAALGFFVQAQINVSYSAASLFLCASFFSGIALAPWLRRTSLTIRYQYKMKVAMLLCTLFITGFTIKQSVIWFKTSEIIQKTDLADKASLESIVDISNHSRVRTIPLAWLAYKIAIEGEHYALLRWISPLLLKSAPEIPFVDIYQVLFYTLANSGELQKACEIGKTIESQQIPGEKNKKHYTEACSNQLPSAYHFGY